MECVQSEWFSTELLDLGLLNLLHLLFQNSSVFYRTKFKRTYKEPRLSITLSLDLMCLLYVRQAVDSNPDILADQFLPDKTT